MTAAPSLSRHRCSGAAHDRLESAAARVIASSSHVHVVQSPNQCRDDHPPERNTTAVTDTPHADLLARHRRVMPSWLALYYDEPIELVAGEGRHVVDGEGNRYLDFFGGILTTMTGYDVPEVVDAIRDAGRPDDPHVDPLPDPPDGRAGRADRAAVGHPRRQGLLHHLGHRGQRGRPAAGVDRTGARTRCWPCATATTAARSPPWASPATGAGRRRASRRSTSSYVHAGYRFRSPVRRPRPTPTPSPPRVDDLRDVLATATAGDVACLIAEPIQGVGGFTVPPDGFFGAMKKVLDEYGILFIADEVQTGWGRTGDHFWGYEAHGVTPDLLTFAKGLGQRPVHGRGRRPRRADGRPDRPTRSRRSAATRSCRPGRSPTCDYLLDHDLQANARAQGARILDALARRWPASSASSARCGAGA